MAKGQMRSNREKKKPKQDKSKKPLPGSSSSQMTELFHKPDPKKSPRPGKK